MIKLPLPDLRDDEVADEFYNSGAVGVGHWRNGMEVLETIDLLLKPYGLEVGHYDRDDNLVYTILPRADGVDGKLKELFTTFQETLNKNVALEDEIMEYHRWISNEISIIDQKLSDIDFYSGGGVSERALLHAKKDVLEKLQSASRSFG